MKKHFSIIRGLRSLCAALCFSEQVPWPLTRLSTAATHRSRRLKSEVSGRNIATGFSSDNTNLAMGSDGVLPTYASFSAAPVASDGVVTISLNGTELYQPFDGTACRRFHREVQCQIGNGSQKSTL